MKKLIFILFLLIALPLFGQTDSPKTTGEIHVTWTANTEGDLAGYYVYRSTDGGTLYPLLADAGDVLTYADSSSLTVDTAYYYKISAYDTDTNESAASSAVSGTPHTLFII